MGWTCTEGRITFDWVDRGSGEAQRSRVAPATRAALRAWLGELLRELLEQGRLPSSWIPPAWIGDLRTTVRLRRAFRMRQA